MTYVLSQVVSPDLYQITSVGCIKLSSNKQHSLHITNSDDMFLCIQIHHRGIKLKRPHMPLSHPDGNLWHIHTQPTVIIGISNIHISYHPKIGTGDTHTGLHRHLKCPWVYVKGVI